MDITAHQIGKTWEDGRVAVRDFTARFAPGSVTALIGRNGSGKTTVLRLLAGLLATDSGSVKRPAGRLGFLFQQCALWPHLNVRSQLELPLRLVVGHAQPAAQADVLMEKFGIAEFATRFPAELSGGQQQRVAIARCLCVEPVAVFLDEITNSLDPAAQHEMALLVEGMRERGLIVISSTHDLAWASRRADQVIYLRDGVTIGQGPPKLVMSGQSDPMFAGVGTWR